VPAKGQTGRKGDIRTDIALHGVDSNPDHARPPEEFGQRRPQDEVPSITLKALFQHPGGADVVTQVDFTSGGLAPGDAWHIRCVVRRSYSRLEGLFYAGQP
jgi:hypothetical protein